MIKSAASVRSFRFGLPFELAGFELSGVIANRANTAITIGYRDDSLTYRDTSVTLKNGVFHYTIKDCTHPFAANLEIGGVRIPLAIAPGYSLKLTADGTSDSTFQASLKITGKGEAANALYRVLQRSFVSYSSCFSQKESDRVITCLFETCKRMDSLYKADTAFYSEPGDRWLPFFKKIVYYEGQFVRLEELCFFLRYNIRDLGPEKTQIILKADIDPGILRDISNPAYLVSPNYLWMIGQGNQYLFYSTVLAKGKDTVPPRLADCLLQIDRQFTDRNRSYFLYTFLNMEASVTGSYEKFLKMKDDMILYAQKIENPIWREKLIQTISKREEALIADKRGSAAPLFALKDTLGRVFRLTDFRGKVVLIDFWASWCGPCRNEIPHLKKLYAGYGGSSDLCFVSIAVRDRDPLWHLAMRQEAMPWLQLWGEGSTEGAYHTEAIPKLVLIDKKGNIVDFNAQGPSEGNKLKAMIDEELGRPIPK